MRQHLLPILILCVMATGLAAQAAPISGVGAIAELQQQPKAGMVEVMSYYAGLNKGGGLFYWDGASSRTPDDCTIFASASADKTGRWVRRDTGALQATMCGVYWDNVHDDSKALSNAFAVASGLNKTLELPGGTGKVCATVKAARAVILRGQGMGTAGAIAQSPTLVDATCMKGGWVFELVTGKGPTQVKAPQYYDFSILTSHSNEPGGCIRWNTPTGGFTDDPNSQNYMLHPHAERIYCQMEGTNQIGLECSKCFDGDFSQNHMVYGRNSVALEGSDVMCLGCAGPNRFAYSSESLVRMAAHGTFGNMDRVVGNEILYPQDKGQRVDSFILDTTRSSTIEANHIEGQIAGVQSAIHIGAGFSHSILNNDIDVLATPTRAAPHWLIADGPFVNLSVFNNGCGGCILGPALINNGRPVARYYNDGGVPQIITHGGNAGNGDGGFP